MSVIILLVLSKIFTIDNQQIAYNGKIWMSLIEFKTSLLCEEYQDVVIEKLTMPYMAQHFANHEYTKEMRSKGR